MGGSGKEEKAPTAFQAKGAKMQQNQDNSNIVKTQQRFIKD